MSLLLLSLQTLGQLQSSRVKFFRATRNFRLSLGAQASRIATWQGILILKATGMSFSCRYGFLVFGEVKHFVHLIHLNWNSCLVPICGLTDYRPFEGITHDSLGLNWIPLRLNSVASTFSSASSPFGPLFHASFPPQVGWVLCVPR